MPLHIAILILQRPSPDLEQPHRHPRSDLRQLNALITRLHKDMVSHLDAVLDIFERHHTAPDLVVGRDGFAGRKEVLQDLAHPPAEPRSKSFEDQMRVGFGNGAAGAVGDVVAEDDVVQGEGGRGAVREVRYGQSGGCAAVFVEKDQVRQTGGGGGGDEVREDEIASVQADGSREEEADFFGEGGEARRWVSRGCNEHAGIDDAREVGIFVVQIQFFFCGAVGTRFVVLEVFA